MNEKQTPDLQLLPFYYWMPFERTCKLLKVYNDGHHYVSTEVLPNKRKVHGHSSLCASSKYFDEQYQLLLQRNEKHPKSLMREIMLAKFPAIENIKEFIKANVKRLWHNLWMRQKRLERKANLNKWNKWVTFTYDSSKHSEGDFKRRLRKCLSNLHSRRGWKYMGVWEHAPATGRLHFHAIMYVPQDQMVGTIEERHDWSTKQHKMQTTHCNTFFEERFGRNDFEELSEYELKYGSALDYLTKYISKTNERIVYSRGIPSEMMFVVNNDQIVAEYYDYTTKYVLYDDFIARKYSEYGTTDLPSSFGRIEQSNMFNDFLLCSS